MVDASMSYVAQLALEPLDGAFDASSEPYEFVAETLRKRQTMLDTAGIRGTRSRHAARTRLGTYEVAGNITLHPDPASLDLLLPRILGAAEAADVFALAETLPHFGVMIDRVAKVFTYSGCKVNRAWFRSRAGGLLELELEIFGKTETVGNVGTFPALTLGTSAAYAPYVHSDAVLTLVGSTRVMTGVEIEIDNHLARRFSNSVSATDVSPQDRTITLRATTPYTSSEADLYGQSPAGVTAGVVYTNGNMSTAFTFGVAQFPDTSPVVNARGEITLPLAGVARMTGSTKELAVTHDSVN